MKREIYTTKKKNTYNQNMKNMIFSSNDNNEYEFKINLLKIEGDAIVIMRQMITTHYLMQAINCILKGVKERRGKIKFTLMIVIYRMNQKVHNKEYSYSMHLL